MADGSFPGLISRNRDTNTTSNTIYTSISDDSGNLVGVTSNALDVNATVTLETAYVDDSAFTIGTDKVNAQGFLADETATDSVDEGDIGLARMTLDRRMITSAEQSGTWDIGTVTTLTGITNDVSIDDGGNTITVDGTIAATQSGTWNIATVTTLTGITNDVNIADGGNSITVDSLSEIVDDTAFTPATNRIVMGGFFADDTATDSVDEGDGGAARMTLDRKQLIVIADPTTDGNRMAINSNGSINVNFTEAAISGEIHDYDTASAIASDATDTHTYTVSTALLLKSVIVSGSGNIKFEIKTGATASPATIAVGFLTGRQGDTKQIFFDPAVEVPTTGTGIVQVIRTNRQGAATDLYSTIIGVDA